MQSFNLVIGMVGPMDFFMGANLLRWEIVRALINVSLELLNTPSISIPVPTRKHEKSNHGLPSQYSAPFPAPSPICHHRRPSFLPIQTPRQVATKPKSAPYPRDVIKAMRNFDFTNVTHKAVTILVRLFVDYRNTDHPSVSPTTAWVGIGRKVHCLYCFLESSPEAVLQSLEPFN
jgi:hypothetical protein